jgi:uncharacterized protein DUF4240
VSKIPTEADEARFWNLVESAWARVGAEQSALRKAVIGREDPDDDLGLSGHLNAFLGHLRALSEDLTAEELTDLDRVLERALYDIDREDIHEVTEGSDDGFLYARGYIVALGREYYEAVRADPQVALDAACEEMCYFFAHLHRKRFGDWPRTDSGISRETCSNTAGWAD